MRLDAPLLASDLSLVGAEVRALEALGYDGAFTFEGPHDPFFPLVLAAEHSERLELATAIAVAPPRSPMQLAHMAHDLQLAARGRFTLGLGTQIRTHIEKRYGAVWSRPIARMREMVAALRAIWRCWNEDAPLDFRGEFFRHTLMPPLFKPPRSAWGPPRILLAGVGPTMTRMVGAVADGLFVHPFNSPEFVRATTLPALAEGFAQGGRTREQFTISCQTLIVTGFSEEGMRAAAAATRLQLAFYASTPQYRCVLDVHGWGAAQEELRILSKAGRWLEMGALIDDHMLETFAVRCEPAELPARLAARWGGVADRVSLLCHAAPQTTHPEAWRDVLTAIRTACGVTPPA
jgi:probable F420-dependent oxidoreductase